MRASFLPIQMIHAAMQKTSMKKVAWNSCLAFCAILGEHLSTYSLSSGTTCVSWLAGCSTCTVCGQILVNLIWLDWFALIPIQLACDLLSLLVWPVLIALLWDVWTWPARASYLPVLNLVRCLVTDCRKMVSYLWEQMLGTYCIHGDVFVETASYLTWPLDNFLCLCTVRLITILPYLITATVLIYQ